MQTSKVRSSSEAPLKISPQPRAARQLKASSDSGSPNSSNQKSRTPKDRSSVTVSDRRSLKGPVAELPKKSSSKVSQLESQISELHLDITKIREQLSLSDTLKQQALNDAEESQKQVSVLSQELEDWKKKFQESFASEEARSIDFQTIAEKRELEWQSKFDALQIHHSADFAALSSAMDEIQRLKSQLETVPNETTNLAEVAATDTNNLEQKLAETLSVVEDMKKQWKECKDAEVNAHALLCSESLIQLETERTAMEMLQLDGTKSSEAYNTLALELEESKGRIMSLEELVCKLKNKMSDSSSEENRMADVELETLKEQLKYMESEVDLLRSAQETAEVEEQIRSTVQLSSASETVENVKSELTRKETDMEVKLEALKSHTADLEANLMDKESELQCIIEKNEALNMKMLNASLNQKEDQLEKELKELKEIVADLKANLMDKETEFQNILEENETLKLELTKETNIGSTKDSSVTELDAAKTAEREAMEKLISLKEEADRSTKRANRVAEQLEAAQAANAEMEAELRRIKVQSDQWRKAAEVAASMLSNASPGNHLSERNGSLEGKFSPLANRTTDSPYSEDLNEDSLKRRNGNGNVLRKFGLSWKKNQK